MKINIDKLAFLARIKLDSKEKNKLQKEFEEILNYVSKLKEVNIKGIGSEQTSKAVDFEKTSRLDENSYQAGEFSEDLLKEIPELEKGYIKVKHILE